MHAIQLISILVFSLYVVVVAVVLYNSAQQSIRAYRKQSKQETGIWHYYRIINHHTSSTY